MTYVGLVDYGMGNLRSVRNALELLGARVSVLEDPAGLSSYGGQGFVSVIELGVTT